MRAHKLNQFTFQADWVALSNNCISESFYAQPYRFLAKYHHFSPSKAIVLCSISKKANQPIKRRKSIFFFWLNLFVRTSYDVMILWKLHRAWIKTNQRTNEWTERPKKRHKRSRMDQKCSTSNEIEFIFWKFSARFHFFLCKH